MGWYFGFDCADLFDAKTFIRKWRYRSDHGVLDQGQPTIYFCWSHIGTIFRLGFVDLDTIILATNICITSITSKGNIKTCLISWFVHVTLIFLTSMRLMALWRLELDQSHWIQTMCNLVNPWLNWRVTVGIGPVTLNPDYVQPGEPLTQLKGDLQFIEKRVPATPM